jgi:hypothetical protein
LRISSWGAYFLLGSTDPVAKGTLGIDEYDAGLRQRDAEARRELRPVHDKLEGRSMQLNANYA